MDRTVQVLFEVSRSLRILLDHFGLEDTALAVPGVFCCVPVAGYPTVYFQGSYLDCRCYQALHSGYAVLADAEAQLRADCYEIMQGQAYDQEYREMLQENRLPFQNKNYCGCKASALRPVIPPYHPRNGLVNGP